MLIVLLDKRSNSDKLLNQNFSAILFRLFDALLNDEVSELVSHKVYEVALLSFSLKLRDNEFDKVIFELLHLFSLISKSKAFLNKVASVLMLSYLENLLLDSSKDLVNFLLIARFEHLSHNKDAVMILDKICCSCSQLLANKLSVLSFE